MRISESLILIGALVWSSEGMARTSALEIESTIPGLSKMTLSNAVGVLNYCKENALLSDASVGALVEALSRKADLKSEDYIVGSSGQILGDAGKNFSIFRARGQLQLRACNIVLERTKQFTR
ncbi:MAG TPA: DUF2501 domain-containing protein [Sphingomicrobium sp.]|nr:DUF2501 domain-containing protein [Sphingomicrobium sp.]